LYGSEGVGFGVGQEWPESSGRGDPSGRGDSSGLSDGRGLSDGSALRVKGGVAWLVPPGWVTGAAPRGAGALFSGGFGLLSGMWLTDWMVDTARSVHTAGLGLRVAAAALSAIAATAPAPIRAGASRHDLLDPTDIAER